MKNKHFIEKMVKNEKWLSYVLSFVFLSNYYVQYILFPITQFNESKLDISILGHRFVLIVYAIVILLIFVNIIYETIKNKENTILIFIVPIITVIIGIVMSFLYNGEFRNDAINFFFYINVAYLSGYAMWKYKLYSLLTKRIESLSILMLPAFIYYAALMATNNNPYTNGVYLGEVNYQHIALAVLPITLALSINFIVFKNYKLFGFIESKYANIIRIALIMILWYCVIIAGGTRSIIFGYLAFTIVAVIYSIYIKENKKKSAILCIIVISLFCVQMVFPLVESSTDRTLLFVENVSEGNLETTYDTKTFSEEEYETLINNSNESDTSDLYANIGSRNTLFTLALKEGLNHPIGGLGIKGFEYKYGLYPHNMVMELISDFGILIAGIIVLGLIILIIKTIIIVKKDKELGYVLIFICGYFIQIMSSGSLYENIPITFAVGLGVPIVLDQMKGKKIKKTNSHKEIIEE